MEAQIGSYKMVVDYSFNRIITTDGQKTVIFRYDEKPTKNQITTVANHLKKAK